MKKIFSILVCAAAPFFMMAQSLSPTVIASTGGFSSNGSGSLSYTVGEMTMVQTFTNGNNILTQGFQQPNDNITGLLDMASTEFGSFVVYPNPAVDNVWFGFQLPEAGKVSLSLYNGVGQKVSDVYYTNYENGKIVDQTNISTLAAGMYFMTMTFTSAKDGKAHISTQKFQVIN